MSEHGPFGCLCGGCGNCLRAQGFSEDDDDGCPECGSIEDCYDGCPNAPEER